MAKRWIGTAVIAACLAMVGQVQAQGWPGYGECSASGMGGGGGEWTPGPMPTKMAPPGPGGDLSISADAPNAFDGCSRCDRPCYCPNGMWFSAAGLGWTMRDPHTAFPVVVPGGPTFGQNVLEYHYFAGFQGDAGFWLNTCRTISAEGGGFVLESNGATFALPPDSLQAASRLWGVQGNLVYVGGLCGCDIAFLGGYAYRDLAESIDINVALPAPPPGNIGPDHFRTRNQLSGGNFGIRLGGVGCHGLFIGGQATIAFGWNHETAVVSGETFTGATITPGGLFATAANSGRLAQDKFAYVPQGEIRIGCQLSRNCMIYGGYTYLYWREVARPGDLIPPVPGGQVQIHQVDFWAQGAQLGFELRY
ncbi:hypothetical protein AYO44_01840 [Planctomycetaceae bacterium SCGC AG-212-F19]|nr:hypothetical protein AYO44_01840 [Planctomycetaceae bacterium SCGC AG-212-F19]